MYWKFGLNCPLHFENLNFFFSSNNQLKFNDWKSSRLFVKFKVKIRIVQDTFQYGHARDYSVWQAYPVLCVIWSTWIQTPQKWFSFCLISGELWDRSPPCHNAGRWLLPVHCGLHHSEQCHVRSDQKEWSTCLSVTVKEFEKYWLSMNKGIKQRKSHFQSLLWNIFILYIKKNHLLLKKM